MISKQEITEALSERVVTVKFKKVNGEERTMLCTLLSSIVPKIHGEPDRIEKERKENPDVVAAWDVEKKGWRSFRIDSILEINK
jgi:hypothetical protein